MAAASQSRARTGSPESGYAMLLVFALSALIAIGLYQQLPRAAFEAQREKESLTIDHGEQYKRAVQLYVRKMNRYPAKIEDLDNTQNIRFLRKHYIDPLTGKDEWRLLHMGNNGKLIDSKIKKEEDTTWHAGSITEFKSPASSDGGGDQGPEGANIGLRKRPSDDAAPAKAAGSVSTDPSPLAMSSNPNQTAGFFGNMPGTPPVNGNIPGNPPLNANPNANPNAPGMPQRPVLPQLNNGMAPGQKGIPGAPGSSAAAAAAGGSVSGNGGYGSGSIAGNGGFANPTLAGNQVNSQTGGQVATPYPTTQGSSSNYNTGFSAAQQMGAGPAQVINNLLTNPRPGGAPAGVGGVGGTVVGGLAGVASTHKGHGVRHYNEQDEYQKWEFYYDATQDVTAMRAGQQLPNTTNNNNNANGQGFGNTNSAGFGNSNSGFGNTNNSGFGNSNNTGSGSSTNGTNTNSNTGFGSNRPFGSGNIGSGNLGTGK